MRKGTTLALVIDVRGAETTQEALERLDLCMNDPDVELINVYGSQYTIRDAPSSAPTTLGSPPLRVVRNQ